MKRSLSLVLLCAPIMFCGCATMNMPAARPSASFYTFKDSEGVGLIRAFRYQGDTVLQFVDVSGETPGIVDGEGRELTYRRVGKHYLVLSGTFDSVTVYEGEASVKVSGKGGREEGFLKAPAPPEGSIPPPPPPPSGPGAEKVIPPVARPASVKPISASASKSNIPSGLPGYVVEAASYTSKHRAEKLEKRLTAMGYAVEIKVRANPKLGTVYGVRLRPTGEIQAWNETKRLRHSLGVKPMLFRISGSELAAYEANW